MSVMILNANSLHIPLADQSVHCVVTSPPYYGLRDYGVDGQLGLEETPEQYIANMVSVFREVWRVLRDDGTLFVNIGDSYMTQPSWGRGDQSSSLEGRKHSEVPHALKDQLGRHERGRQPGIKPKDLIGIPWMLAFALRADGWYLRSDIIWHKPNPMPESVTDRPTKAHEYVFLLTKQARYYYDADAVMEENADPTRTNYKPGKEAYTPGNVRDDSGRDRRNDGFQAYAEGKTCIGRNRRTVWTIATEPTPYAHFATYPRALVEPCIKAGTSERGVCPVCGAPWERNWRPTCAHDAQPVPATVFDPFGGSGTTALVARQLGRNAVICDLSITYLADIARKRLGFDALKEWAEGIQADNDGYHDLPLFQT